MAIDFNTEPYFDDYKSEKDFYRILFRPSYAVQARELTQIQTILQTQVTRFGDHVFKNGSQVIPGSVNADNKVHFIKLEQFTGTVDVTTYIETLKNKIVTGETSGVKMRVLDTSEGGVIVDNLDVPTLYCKVEGTADDTTTNRLIPGENLVAYEADNQISTNFRLKEDQLGDITAVIRILGDAGETGTTYKNNSSSDVIGFGYSVDVQAGIYYVDGVFVRNDDLKLYVGRFSNSPSCRVGFKITEDTVAPEDDDSILDNATGSYNFAAPGAHRYKISLSLVKLDLVATDNIRFIELLRVVDGRIQHKIEKSSYAELEKTLARRTYDESGNYEVNKFKLSAREHMNVGSNLGVYPELIGAPVEGVTYGDLNKFVLVVDPGKAYIQGYEVESTATQYVTFDKAREVGQDEGNHIARIDDQPIGLNVGNYVLVKNVYKTPDFTSFEQVYLVKTLTATPGAAPTASDIIGTARVKAIQLHSSDYTGGTSTVYKLGLIDVTMYNGYSFEADVKRLTGMQGSANFTCDVSPSLIALLGSATTTSGSAVVTGQRTNFLSSVKVGDVLYLNGSFIGTVQSITDNLSLTLTANTAAVVSAGAVGLFSAPLQEPDYSSMMFPIGYNTVKTLRGLDQLGGDTVKSSSIAVRRKFAVMNTAVNKATFEITNTNETFLSDADLSNFLLINNDTNLPTDISAATIAFDNDALRKRVDITGVANGNYYLIATVQQTNTAAQEKTKVLRDTWSESITSKKLVTSSVIELRKADALRLKSVRETPGDYSAYSLANSIDITERYTLDNGQRATHYTNAKLILKPGYQVPSGAISVEYDYFDVSAATGNFFSVDSYASIPYSDIPSFTITDPTTGKKFETCLSDVFDFRPIIGGENTFFPEIPKIGSDAQTPLAYYMGRKDKIILDSIGRINVIKGIPALQPQQPEDPKEGMVLASIGIPPYTKNVADIIITQRDNRRYTMRDIGKLDRRISNLEYYVTLNLLEKDTATMQIRDNVTGLDKFKNGFIVDQFTGHNIGDVKNDDYRVAIDAESRILRPMHFTTALDIVEDLASGSDRIYKTYQKTGDLVTLPYTENDFIFNNNATRAMDVQAMSMGALKGQIALFPEGDNWKSIDRRPDLVAVDDNNYDAIKWMAEQLNVTGTKWNEWQTNWTSITQETPKISETRVASGGVLVTGYETTVTNYSGYDYRSGISTSLSSTVNSQDHGDRVVDMSYIPFMRARPITFVAQNLKAKTSFWAVFDNTDVSEYIKPADTFVVQRNGQTLIDFNVNNLIDGVLVDDAKRAYQGKIEPAFSIGDVVTNTPHIPVGIQTVQNLTGTSNSFTLSVTDTSGISVGHHVVVYNMDYHNAYNQKNLDDLQDNQIIPASIGISDTTTMSKEINLRKFLVTGVSGQQLTLSNIDGTSISAFSAYSTASYTGGKTGMLFRLKAAGVVANGGHVLTSDAIGPIQQEIQIVNIKNGFAVGDMVSGSINIGGTTAFNVVNVVSINNSTSTTVAPTLKALGDGIVTDVDGVAVGVFYLPENENLSFRTGERVFKLTDNQSNSNAFFDSIGSTTYYAQGITLSKERTIVSTRSAVFTQADTYEDTQSLPAVRRASTSTRIIYQYRYDPLAQTFTVSSSGGVFVSSIDLYFSVAGNRPVTVELRNTDNGVPSSKIIPFSEVTLSPSELKTSANSSVATTFKFKSPIYLQEGETYAFVVKTDEPGCQLYVSEMGQEDIITKNTIAGQPLTGSLYASQNAKEWEIHSLLDIKFNLKKCLFSTNANAIVLFKANPALTYTLPSNPFEITPNTKLVRVYAPDHGFLPGELVTISNVQKGFYGTAKGLVGIPEYLLNTTHTVYANGVDRDSFIIDLVTTDANGNYLLGGSSSSTSSNTIGTGSKTLTVGEGLGYSTNDTIFIEYSAAVWMRGTVTGYTGSTLTVNVTAVSGSGTYNTWKVYPDFVKGEYGGSDISCSRCVKMDSMFLKTSDISFQDTKIEYYIDTEDEAHEFSGWTPVVANTNTFFTTRRHVNSYDNQTVLSEAPLQKKSSVLVKAVLTSTNPNVSPAVDLQKISAFAITNRVDNDSANTINVAAIDTRTLLSYGDLTTTDTTNITASGTITATTGSSTVTGVGTVFTTQVVAGNTLLTTGGVVIGTVQSVGSNTSITLTGNAAVAVTGGAYWIRSTPTLYFENVTYNGVTHGVIRTNIDTADNLLGNANIGKTLTIANALTGVDGTYVIKNIDVATDKATYAGNSELDLIRVYVYPAFNATGNIDMISDTDFTITMQNKFIEDFAPVGCHNAANYITRTLTLANAADQLKVIFDASIINKTDIVVYYRTWTGDVDMRKLPYKNIGFTNQYFDAQNVFTERTIDLENMTPFTNIQIKIVMKSSLATAVPMVKNLRILALS